MIERYFTTGLRHLWRYRLFSIVNVFGLAVSISACWIIYRIVSYEFSYDKNVPDKENIYKLITGTSRDDVESYTSGVSAPIYQGVREQIQGLEHVVPVYYQYIGSVEIQTDLRKPLSIEEPQGIVATDAGYFSMLPYTWLAGNKSLALKSPENVVLTESRANVYFPGKSPAELIGRTITYYGVDTLQKTIAGVVADRGKQTDFTANEFFLLQEKVYTPAEWTNTSSTEKLYLHLKKGANPNDILKHIEKLAGSKWNEVMQKNNFGSLNVKRWFKLMSLSESHFSTEVSDQNVRKVSKPVLYGLLGIALFLLILAGINYINICIAQIPQRAKEIGVRKTLGGGRCSIIGQFLNETLLITLFAAAVAVLFTWLGFRTLRDVIPEEIAPIGNPAQLILFILILIVSITIFAGIYPAWLIARVKTVNIFRGHYINEKSGRKFNLQKVLTVTQFVIALVFITGALIMGRQLRYTLKSDMGFNKEAILLMKIPYKYLGDSVYRNRQYTLLNELKREPGIQSVTLGTPPTEDYSSSPFQYVAGKEPVGRQLIKKSVDANYIPLYKMKLLAGRNIIASDTINEYIINEAAMHAFNFASPQEAVGKMINQLGRKGCAIVGVVQDFHLEDFYKKIEPAVLQNGKETVNILSVKLIDGTVSKRQDAIKSIEDKWSQFYPAESFSYKFYDETLEALYKQERNLSKLINLATIVAIFISCLGLFGLVTLITYQRTKEIGIRKILGASSARIVQILSREYIFLVVLSFLIAAPIAWWGMHKWLERFEYRIEIEWWMFAVAGLAILLIAMATVSFRAIKAAIANPVKSLKTE